MRISTKGEYGVRAMLELALAYGDGPIPLKIVAERQGISEPYLEQLMAILRKAGLVQSVRGAQGGYELAQAPEATPVGDIVRALEGPVSPMECVQHPTSVELCGHVTRCAVQVLWQRLASTMNQVLDSTTLADLVHETQRLQARTGGYVYQI
ncbi:RrF2 family transcriptional regulator [Limnochorda pilosa]|uniref:AsnC family transcriptional regulator n=1 Tax=Limnochorda pilosa TaxID=1555112 RepID=A0A0K2SMU7_LIMPI|nr:Rrf2 family transcriptional regulator [Limnochorda pilosa]BAS28453.1 AsnC family transcriptional regulator [Limnochorda pilosa]